MHIDEFAMLLGRMRNEHTIITHTTQRKAMSEIRKILRNAMPPEQYQKVTILAPRTSR